MKIVDFICNKCKRKFNLLYWKRRKDIYYFLDNPECPHCKSDNVRIKK